MNRTDSEWTLYNTDVAAARKVLRNIAGQSDRLATWTDYLSVVAARKGIPAAELSESLARFGVKFPDDSAAREVRP